MAAAIFGHQWKGHLVQFSVDNLVVVHILNSTYSKDSHFMHLVHILMFLAAHFDFWFVAKHLEGNANSLVDDLSCDNLSHFFSQVPKAEYNKPPQVPPSLLDLLGYNHHIWTSTLDQAVWEYYTTALTPETHKTYKAAEHKYLTFCINFNLSPLPTSECLLCYFATYLGQDGLASSTILTYVSVRQLLKDIKVQAVRTGRHPCPRLPITPSILRKLRRVWLEGSPIFNNAMLWAASTTTFFDFCRSGEVTVQWIKVWPTNVPVFFKHRSGQCPFPKYHFHQVETLKDRPIQERSETSYGKNKWRSLHSHSIAIILNSSWRCSWSSLSMGQPHTIKVKICESRPSCTASSQRTCTPLHRTQLLHRSSNNSNCCFDLEAVSGVKMCRYVGC